MMRVLVIDDDVEFTEHLKAVKPVEVSMDVVHDSESVFAHLQVGTPDVIVLDLSMAPTLATDSASEGLAILGAIMGGHRGRVPVVIATESEDDDTEAWCRKLGAAAVLHKADGLGQVFDAAREVVVGTEEDWLTKAATRRFGHVRQLVKEGGEDEPEK